MKWALSFYFIFYPKKKKYQQFNSIYIKCTIYVATAQTIKLFLFSLSHLPNILEMKLEILIQYVVIQANGKLHKNGNEGWSSQVALGRPLLFSLCIICYLRPFADRAWRFMSWSWSLLTFWLMHSQALVWGQSEDKKQGRYTELNYIIVKCYADLFTCGFYSGLLCNFFQHVFAGTCWTSYSLE